MKKSRIVLFVIGVVIVIGLVMLFNRSSNNIFNSVPATKEDPKHIGIIQWVVKLDGAVTGFKEEMTKLGYIEGENIFYEYENVNGNREQVKEVAKRYIEEDVDLMLVITATASKIVLDETIAAGNLIPIVFTNGVGADQLGLIESFQSSGNNTTGVISDDVGVSLKKLDFIQRINPNLRKIGLIVSNYTKTRSYLGYPDLHKRAEELGFEIKDYVVDSPPGPSSTGVLKGVLASIQKGEVEMYMTLADPIINFRDNANMIVDLGKEHKVPTFFLSPINVEQGGLLAYDTDFSEMGKQVSVMADKIFRGAMPEDIPIEFPRKNILIINLKTAEEIGVEIPESLRAIADILIN